MIYAWLYQHRFALQVLLFIAGLALHMMRPPAFRVIEGAKAREWRKREAS